MMKSETLFFLFIFISCYYFRCLQNVSACEKKMIGQHCKSVCRCSNCSRGGLCENKGWSCERGWFGSYCQYSDLAKLYFTDSRLMDNNDSTCAHFYHGTVFVDYKRPAYFTFVRIQFRKPPNLHPNVSLTFSDGICRHLRILQINNVTYDLYCETQNTTTFFKINLHDLTYFICAVHINGGRNIGIGQSMFLTSKEYKPKQDFITTADPGSCTSTNPLNDFHPILELSLGHSFWTERIVFENQQDPIFKRALSFKLVCLYENQSEVVIVSDGTPSKSVIFFPRQTSFITIRVQLNNQSSIKGMAYISTCDLHVFGDCKPPWYGLDCTSICSLSCKKQDCHVNGFCRKCRDGWTGPDCLHGGDGNDIVTHAFPWGNFTTTTHAWTPGAKTKRPPRVVSSISDFFAVAFMGACLCVSLCCVCIVRDSGIVDQSSQVSTYVNSRTRGTSTLSYDSAGNE